MCSEKTRNPITWINVARRERERDIEGERDRECVTSRGPINTGGIFLFIVIMTCQQSSEGRKRDTSGPTTSLRYRHADNSFYIGGID